MIWILFPESMDSSDSEHEDFFKLVAVKKEPEVPPEGLQGPTKTQEIADIVR